MEHRTYQMLCYTLPSQQQLGVLVGASQHQVLAPTVEGLKSKMKARLQTQWRREQRLPHPYSGPMQLKVVRERLQPSYHQDNGVFPLPYEVELAIPAIHGLESPGRYYCFLPWFDEQFVYYAPEQLDALIDYAIRIQLNLATPAQVQRWLRWSLPTLSQVEFSTTTRHRYPWHQRQVSNSYPQLSRLAEKYPPPRATRRRWRYAPEAAWEREREVAEVVDKLLQAGANVLVVGAPGSGKSTVLHQVTKKIGSINTPGGNRRQFWRLLPQRLENSGNYLGDWEATGEQLLAELADGIGILWVVGVVHLLKSGGGSPAASMAAFLTTALQEGRIQMVAEATLPELENMRRLLPRFVDAFQVVYLEPLRQNQVALIFQRFGQYAALAHQITFEPSALAQAMRLLQQYYPHESFPGKGIQLLSTVLAKAKAEQQTQITAAEVIQALVQQTGLPPLLLDDQAEWNPGAIRAFFTSRILGQPRVAEQLVNLVKVFKAAIHNPQRPIATLLFAGPTGVGKTASAKALAEFFFSNGQSSNPLIRLDMSEYQFPHQVLQLFGQGTEPGALVRAVREKPFAVVLLDEIEKADPSIFDALLGVLDEGRLTDGLGRVTYFTNTIIILTTNLGAQYRQIALRTAEPDSATAYWVSLERHFKAEFLNRIDELIVFDKLFQETILQLTDHELKELAKRPGITQRQLKLVFSEQLVKYLADIGFDERYGARHLQRTIDQVVSAAIAQWLLLHPNAQGKTLQVDYDNGVVVEEKSEERFGRTEMEHYI